MLQVKDRFRLTSFNYIQILKLINTCLEYFTLKLIKTTKLLIKTVIIQKYV